MTLEQYEEISLKKIIESELSKLGIQNMKVFTLLGKEYHFAIYDGEEKYFSLSWKTTTKRYPTKPQMFGVQRYYPMYELKNILKTLKESPEDFHEFWIE